MGEVGGGGMFLAGFLYLLKPSHSNCTYQGETEHIKGKYSTFQTKAKFVLGLFFFIVAFGYDVVLLDVHYPCNYR